MTTLSEKELLALKERQEQAKNKISNLRGREENTLQQLQDQWQCKDAKQAKQRSDALQEEIQNLNAQFRQGCEELEQWLEEQRIDV